LKSILKPDQSLILLADIDNSHFTIN